MSGSFLEKVIMNYSRREALVGISGLALATTSTLFAANESKKENIIPVPWEHKKLILILLL